MDGICLTDLEEPESGLEEAQKSENIRDKESKDTVVGITFGDVGITSLKCNVCRPIDKGEYVMMAHPTADLVLGQVESVERKTNVSAEMAMELSMGEDVEIEETVIANIKVIGFRDNRSLLKTPGNPFRAGEKIYIAKDKLIKDVLGLKNDDSGAYVGKLRGHDIEVKLNINTMAQKHLSVLAKTGSGKSYTTGVIIEEMMKNDVTLVILDPHGEYSSLAKAGSVPENDFGIKPRGYGNLITEFSPDPEINKGAKPLKFSFKNMKPRKILDMIGVNKIKSNVSALEGAMSRLTASKGFFGIPDVIRLLKENEEGNSSPIISGLESLYGKGVFDARGTRMDDIVRKGKTAIINLKGTEPDVQAFVVSRLSTALFELRKRNKIPPMMMFAEEAHNFCPQRGKIESSEIFQTIASEGRKFGLGLGIITQRPAKVDKNVLSQCNTQVILKVTNPNDLKAIELSVEGLSKEMAEEIQRLSIGEAIVSGGGLSEPLFLEVRPRESQDGGSSIRVVG
ncbi:MAG: ATP-binding protein [Thermoplasmata archaeon]